MTEEDKIKEKDNFPDDESTQNWWERFKKEWSHAFSMKVDDDQFNPDDLELIENVAKDIVARQLAAPAVMFLVSVQPLSFLMAQGMQMLKPFVPSNETASKGKDFAERFAIKTLVTKPGAYERFALLLETQEGVERLIDAIEKHEDERIIEKRNTRKKKKQDRGNS